MDVLRVWVFVLVAAVSGSPIAHPSEAKPLEVVASFTILGEWARIVGGDDVSVTTLVGPDADAHVYEPTPSDVQRVAAADLLVVNGLGFEGWMSRLSGAAGFTSTTVVASRGIAPRMAGGQPDPHAWHDLRNAVIYVRNIAQALSAKRPAAASRFAGRADAYIAQLDALEVRTRAALAAIPREQRVAVVSHDAFGYLAESYQLELLPALGLSTDAEPSAAAIGDLIRQIRAHRVRAVFIENIRDPRLITRIAAEGEVAIGGRLYSDALGPPGSPAATFIELYRYNVATLIHALRHAGTS
jgi:zinc/manganese transport system substrate-binding protein